MTYRISRSIEIDAGHRIMTHGSKCRHLHGHRYRIEAHCEADSLHLGGEQAGMVLDFGFLKDEMMTIIDAPCDHGFLASVDDAGVLSMFAPPDTDMEMWYAQLAAKVREHGALSTTDTKLGSKLYVVPFQPTAEALARHWFHLLAEPVLRRSDNQARLCLVRVWETPNCSAEYQPLT